MITAMSAVLDRPAEVAFLDDNETYLGLLDKFAAQAGLAHRCFETSRDIQKFTAESPDTNVFVADLVLEGEGDVDGAVVLLQIRKMKPGACLFLLAADPDNLLPEKRAALAEASVTILKKNDLTHGGVMGKVLQALEASGIRRSEPSLPPLGTDGEIAAVAYQKRVYDILVSEFVEYLEGLPDQDEPFMTGTRTYSISDIIREIRMPTTTGLEFIEALNNVRKLEAQLRRDGHIA